jgi:hypothetical protein
MGEQSFPTAPSGEAGDRVPFPFGSPASPAPEDHGMTTCDGSPSGASPPDLTDEELVMLIVSLLDI